MPSRKPILPAISGSKRLLKNHQSEINNSQARPLTTTNFYSQRNSDMVDNLTRNKDTWAESRNSKTRIAANNVKDTYRLGTQMDDDSDASSSSGSHEHDNTNKNQKVESDLNDFSNDVSEDDLTNASESRETDGRVVRQYNQQHRNPGTKLALTSTDGERFIERYPQKRDEAVFRQRASGTTSYVRLVKETEDKMKVIRRNHETMPSQRHYPRHGGELSEKEVKEIMAKRKSTNSITLMYGNSTNDSKHSAHAEIVGSDHARSDICGRGLEVEGHLRRLQGGRVTVVPIGQRQNDGSITASNQRTNSVEAPRPKPRAIQRKSQDDGSDVEYPLRELALSETHISLKKAKSLEKAAKHKIKLLKSDIVNAKLDVAEARMGEFSTTLLARQAHIEERHAKLCRRQAVLRKMEQEQDGLEAKMDEKEEEHRLRERRIKNRERRVKQEEAGIKLKEESLRKREEKVTDGIEQIESRRRIVEQKEEVQKAMKDIMEKKEELHGKHNTKNNTIVKPGIFDKLLTNSLKKQSNNCINTPYTRSFSSTMSTGVHDPKSLSNSQLHGMTRNKDDSDKCGVMSLWI